jgi:hypothetical protein
LLKSRLGKPEEELVSVALSGFPKRFGGRVPFRGMDLTPSDDRDDPLMETSHADSAAFLRFWLLLSDREDRDKADDKAENDMFCFRLSSLDGPDAMGVSGKWAILLVAAAECLIKVGRSKRGSEKAGRRFIKW